MVKREMLFVLLIYMVTLISCNHDTHSDALIGQSRAIISEYKAVFTSPPQNTPSFKSVDGPITGNGDIGLTLSGEPEHQTYWISKNDFWKSGPHFKQCGPSLIGGIDIIIDDMEGSNYHVEQHLYDAKLLSTFEKDNNSVEICARVAAGDNMIILKLEVSDRPVQVDLRLWAKDGYGSITDGGQHDHIAWVTRKFDTDELLYPSAAIIAATSGGKEMDSFVLDPSEPVMIIFSVATNHESETYENDAIDRLSDITTEDADRLIDEHNEWWANFWAESYVDIEDELIEKHYYASNYIMACCSRNKNFPPGLYGNWITMDRTAWSGDIHLNYNHEAPFWALYSSNHIGLTECYDAPLIEHLPVFMENAKRYLNKKGAYASVGIGPKGLTSRFFDMVGMDTIYGEKFGSSFYRELTGQPMFLGQKSNAVFASMNMILRHRYTYDIEYAKKVYPYLLAVADFWEDYLVFENGRYVIYDDSFHEVGPWQGPGWEEGYGDFNPINTLGFLHTFFEAIIEISADLGVDQVRHGKWQHILSHLSDFPVSEEDGTLQFRAVEGGDGSSRDLKGFQWYMLHGLVFPATNIGLGSDTVQINMIRSGISSWDEGPWLRSGNSIQSVLIGATRVGYDPQTLIQKAKQKIKEYASPNLWIYAGGGGIETCSAIPGMINEMMLQSHEGVIRVFPVYPREEEASFHRLRTFGALLVSSEFDHGEVKYIVVESEKGKICRILNPWPEEAINVARNGKVNENSPSRILDFETSPGEKIIIAPSGEDIKSLMRKYRTN
jgi:hypothetical protein